MAGDVCMGAWKQTGRSTFKLNHLALAWDNSLATWAVIGDADEVAISAERREVLALLEQIGRPMKPHEIAGLLDKKVNNIRQLAFQMALLGERITAQQAALASRLQAADTLLATLESQQKMVSASLEGLSLTLYGRKE